MTDDKITAEWIRETFGDEWSFTSSLVSGLTVRIWSSRLCAPTGIGVSFANSVTENVHTFTGTRRQLIAILKALGSQHTKGKTKQ